MFDPMIREVAQRFGLGDKAGPFVQNVVGMMTDERSGGLPGFLSAFDEGGMGSAVRSWVGKGASEEIDASQVESALGDGAIADLARKFGLDRGIVGGALAFLIPRVVDLLTPDGAIDEVGQAARKGGGTLKWLFLLLVAALVLWWFAKSCQLQSADGGIGEGAETAEMLAIRGYGSAQPVASNDTEEGRFRNHRIGYTLVD